MSKLRWGTMLLVAASLMPAVAAAQTIDALCATVTKTVNTLVPGVTAYCTPSAKDSLVVVSAKPVLGNPDRVKAFALVSCAAAGEYMNEHPKLKVGELWLGDVDSARTKTGYSLPASACGPIQREMHAGKMTPQEAMARIERSMTKRYFQ